jgi:hypothetical protein
LKLDENQMNEVVKLIRAVSTADAGQSELSAIFNEAEQSGPG